MAEPLHPYCRCLFYSANALARGVTRLAEEAFAPSGLAPSLAFVLMSVNRHPGIQPKELARIMMLHPSTVTRLLEKLEGRGLLRRRSEGKAVFVHPSAAGKKVYPALQAAWRHTYARYVRVLGESVARDLTEGTYSAAVALETTSA
ncbi:MAG: MarR family transcriptional regulator [Acidobacteria bacterium]|nr:MarR family transcriptional regulator [Acidobacteriota bacterium]